MLSYHEPGSERILEIPIYRCSDEQHRKEEQERFESWIEPFEAGYYLGGRTPERVKIWDEHRERSYSDMTTKWDFNEIVGWIRLYTWPGNIRAYLFFVKERITKVMRRKTFDTRRGNFIEMRTYPEQSNEEILVELRARILAGVAEHRRLRRLYVDLGVLDVLGPHIDWIGLTKPPKPVFDKDGFWAELVDAQKPSSI
jgi:hypothetical protein